MDFLKSELQTLLDMYKELPNYNKVCQRYGIIRHAVWLIGNTIYNLNELMPSKINLGDSFVTQFKDGSIVHPVRVSYPEEELLIKIMTLFLSKIDAIKEEDKMFAMMLIARSVGEMKMYKDVTEDGIMGRQKKPSKTKEKPQEKPQKIEAAPEQPETPKAEETPKTDPEKPHQCPHCERAFGKKFALTNHINAAH